VSEDEEEDAAAAAAGDGESSRAGAAAAGPVGERRAPIKAGKLVDAINEIGEKYIGKAATQLRDAIARHLDHPVPSSSFQKALSDAKRCHFMYVAPDGKIKTTHVGRRHPLNDAAVIPQAAVNQ